MTADLATLIKDQLLASNTAWQAGYAAGRAAALRENRRAAAPATVAEFEHFERMVNCCLASEGAEGLVDWLLGSLSEREAIALAEGLAEWREARRMEGER